MAEHDLEPKRLREVLEYDPARGTLTWLKGWRAGTLAGSVTTKGYVSVTIDGVTVYAHRVAWAIQTGAWPPRFIDHRNGRRADNRWRNLRLAEPHENGSNRARANTNNQSTGVLGVYRLASGRGYRASISAHLGSFKTLAAAKLARIRAERLLHREFAASKPASKGKGDSHAPAT